MPDQDNNELHSRIARLELRVKELERQLERDAQPDDVEKEATEGNDPQRKSTESPQQKTGFQVDSFQFGEKWLNRIGIGLLLIGVAFLFKYSIDQGWLIPPVRSAIGLGIGVVLFVSGLNLNISDKPLKQILLGGGIAAFYITGFATYQFYSFLPGVVIWLFMIVITLLALSLSLQQNEAVLSIVGTLGALGTPFMLYSGEGSIPMLMLYLTLVLAGTCAVYMEKGWKTLLWSFAMGGFVVLCVGIFDISSGTAALNEKWALQAGAIFWVMTSWILPVGREVLSVKNPRRWPDPKMLRDVKPSDNKTSYRTSSTIHLMVFLIPLFLLSLCHGIWNFSMTQAGLTSLGLALLGSVFSLPLKKRGIHKLASSHILLGLVMLTIGIFMLLEGNALFVVLAAETIALRYIARQTGDSRIGISSHILFGIVIYWLFYALSYGVEIEKGLLNLESISQLAFIAAGGLLIPAWLRKDDLRQIYQIVSHIVFLVWLYQKFSVFENGQAWVTVTWGAYAVILLILGFIRYGNRMRLAGMATIFIVVGKLFLVDLSRLQAIWRILLFTGFGAVFLILGYYGQSKWKNRSEQM